MQEIFFRLPLQIFFTVNLALLPVIVTSETKPRSISENSSNATEGRKAVSNLVEPNKELKIYSIDVNHTASDDHSSINEEKVISSSSTNVNIAKDNSTHTPIILKQKLKSNEKFHLNVDSSTNKYYSDLLSLSLDNNDTKLRSWCPPINRLDTQQPPRLSFLDDMLKGYDKRAWPTYGTGNSTKVAVNIYVNSLGSVSAANMEYSMDIYLRQSWKDERLNLAAFGINCVITLNGEDIVDKIWKPDIFFRNVKDAKFHMVTVPNKLIKLSPDGNVLFSMRLTLKLACRMSFRHYPLDTQTCHVVLGSYAQTIDQVEINWKRRDPIVIDQPLELPEFDVTGYAISRFTRDIDTGSFSFLNVSFTMERQNGYHLIQTYLPTFLIVMISWVSFWLNVDSTPGRVTLGVTTLLTLTTVASGVRTQLPPVSYVKAIDVWIGACSVMVFGALLEFTLVNYLSRSKLKPEELKKSINIFQWSKKVDLHPPAMDDHSVSENEVARNLKRARNVDRASRVLFPLLFFTFNMVYWPYYLYVPDRN